MKALPMLDHVMLWVARGFSTLYLVFAVLIFVSAQEHMIRSPPPEIEIILFVASAFLFCAGTWLSVGLLCRISVGLGAVIFGIRDLIFLLGNLFSVPESTPWHPSLFSYHYYIHTDALSFALLFGVPLVGYFSIIWALLRPSVESSNFPNPVNLVNSV